MKHPILRTFASAMIALAAAPAFASDEAALLDEARGVASSIPPKLLAVLKAEIEKAGPKGRWWFAARRRPRWQRPPPKRQAGRSVG